MHSEEGCAGFADKDMLFGAATLDHETFAALLLPRFVTLEGVC